MGDPLYISLTFYDAHKVYGRRLFRFSGLRDYKIADSIYMRNILAPDMAVVEAFAVGAHAGQVDKNGDPYMAHPRAVTKLVQKVPSYRLLDDWQRAAAGMAAMLHDVLEDTNATRFDMVSIGVPVPVVDIVQLLTFAEGDDREEYYRKIIANPVALVVKIADVAHNTSEARTARLSEEDRNRLATKYEKAMSVLGSVNPADLEWWREGR